MSAFKVKNGIIVDSGGIQVTGSISSTAGITGSFSGSIAGFPTDVSSFSSSLSTRITSTEATASQYVAASGSLAARIASNEARTGSYATTGSNYFIGQQVITGSVYISSDLIVQGSSSLQNITASAVSIGTNTVILNTDSPAVRFAGISVRDSGSNSGVTSSIWYDSLNNKWIYQNESGSSYSGGMFISGPRNTGSLGDEDSMTNGYIAKGLGGDHIGPSIIFESGSTNIGIGTATPTAKLHVQGTSYFFDQSIFGDKLGIGTSSPGVSLDVSGSGIRIIHPTAPNIYLNNTTVQWKSYLKGNSFTINDAVRDVLTLGYNGAASYFSGSNVGIGITSPNSNSRLHVYKGGGSYDTIVADGDAGTNTGFAIYEAGSAKYAIYNNGYGGNDSFNIWNVAASADSLTILASGNTGIGYSNPTYQLQVLNTIGLRANSQNFQAIKGTGWGYSPGSYRVVMLGDVNPSNFTTVSIGYDPSGNANGSFTGDGREVLFRNGASFATPTSSDTSFHLNTLVLKDGKIGIGTDVPSNKLDVTGGSIRLTVGGTSATYLYFHDTYTYKYLAYYIDDAYWRSPGSHFFEGQSGYKGVWDSNGRVGIGTTSPVTKLHVLENGLFTNSGTDSGASYVPTQPILTVTTDGNGGASSVYANNAVFKVGIGGGSTGNVTTEWFRVNLNGRVGIGMTSMPYGNLAIKSNNATSYYGLNVFANGNGNFTFVNHNNNVGIIGTEFGTGGTGHTPLVFAINALERMRIAVNGDITLGVTAAYDTAIIWRSDFTGDVRGRIYATGGPAVYIKAGESGGVVLTSGATSWSAVSDERSKTNLTPIENGIDKVNQLRSVTGRYLTDDESKSRSFLIAQDVLSVLPEAVSTDEETGMMVIQYTEVIPLLVASIKELSAKVAALEAQQ